MESTNAETTPNQDLDDSGCVQDASVTENGYKGQAHLLDLSDDVLLLILKNCSPRDLKALGHTCPRLGALVCDRTLWTRVDARANPIGEERLRWYMTHCLSPATQELQLKGYANKKSKCLGIQDLHWPVEPETRSGVSRIVIGSPVDVEHFLLRMWYPHLPRFAVSPRWPDKKEQESKLQKEAKKEGPNESGSSGPRPSKPGPSKPDQSEPGSSKPEQSEPAPNKPDQSETGPSEPGPSKPGPNKSDQTDPVKSEPSSNKPGQSEPSSNEPGPSKPGPNEPDPSEPGPSKKRTRDPSEDPFCKRKKAEAGPFGKEFDALKSDCKGPQFTLTTHLLRDLRNKCCKLTSLTLEYCNIDYKTTNICQFPPTLKKLSLRGTLCYNLPLNTSYLGKIQDRLPGLEHLDVSECDWFEAATLMPLSKLSALKNLYMRSCRRLAECVAYASLAARYGFKALRVIDVRGSPLADSEVSALGWLPLLEELYCSPPEEFISSSEHTHSWKDIKTDVSELDLWEKEEPEYYKLKTPEPSEEVEEEEIPKEEPKKNEEPPRDAIDDVLGHPWLMHERRIIVIQPNANRPVENEVARERPQAANLGNQEVPVPGPAGDGPAQVGDLNPQAPEVIGEPNPQDPEAGEPIAQQPGPVAQGGEPIPEGQEPLSKEADGISKSAELKGEEPELLARGGEQDPNGEPSPKEADGILKDAEPSAKGDESDPTGEPSPKEGELDPNVANPIPEGAEPIAEGANPIAQGPVPIPQGADPMAQGPDPGQVAPEGPDPGQAGPQRPNPGPRGPNPGPQGHNPWPHGHYPGPHGPNQGPHGPNQGPHGPNQGPHGPNQGPHGPNHGRHGPNPGPHGYNRGPQGHPGPYGPNRGPQGHNPGPYGPNQGPYGPNQGPHGRHRRRQRPNLIPYPNMLHGIDAMVQDAIPVPLYRSPGFLYRGLVALPPPGFQGDVPGYVYDEDLPGLFEEGPMFGPEIQDPMPDGEVIDEPAQEPMGHDPVNKDPVDQDPAGRDPVGQDSAGQEPVAQEPAVPGNQEPPPENQPVQQLEQESELMDQALELLRLALHPLERAQEIIDQIDPLPQEDQRPGPSRPNNQEPSNQDKVNDKGVQVEQLGEDNNPSPMEQGTGDQEPTPMEQEPETSTSDETTPEDPEAGPSKRQNKDPGCQKPVKRPRLDSDDQDDDDDDENPNVPEAHDPRAMTSQEQEQADRMPGSLVSRVWNDPKEFGAVPCFYGMPSAQAPNSGQQPGCKMQAGQEQLRTEGESSGINDIPAAQGPQLINEGEGIGINNIPAQGPQVRNQGQENVGINNIPAAQGPQLNPGQENLAINNIPPAQQPQLRNQPRIPGVPGPNPNVHNRLMRNQPRVQGNPRANNVPGAQGPQMRNPRAQGNPANRSGAPHRRRQRVHLLPGIDHLLAVLDPHMRNQPVLGPCQRILRRGGPGRRVHVVINQEGELVDLGNDRLPEDIQRNHANRERLFRELIRDPLGPFFNIPPHHDEAHPHVPHEPMHEPQEPHNEENRPQNEEHRPQNEENRPQNEEHRPENEENRPRNPENRRNPDHPFHLDFQRQSTIHIGHAGYHLVSDSAILRFGRADNENVNYVNIGPNGIRAGDPGTRPDRSNLRILSVTGYRNITDRSLVHLATAAPHIVHIDFTETNVTSRGVETFKALRPNCEVIFSKHHKSD